MYPDWIDKKESLLTEDELCERLLANSGNYCRIGPLAQELKFWTKSLKTLHSDSAGLIMDSSLIKSLGQQADEAIETVAFTYIIHYMRVELRKYVDDKEELKRVIESARTNVSSNHGVALTSQMEAFFTEFQEGKRTGAEHDKAAVETPLASFHVAGGAAACGSASSSSATSSGGAAGSSSAVATSSATGSGGAASSGATSMGPATGTGGADSSGAAGPPKRPKLAGAFGTK